MIDYVWVGMILIGIIYASISGNFNAVTVGIIDESKNAITLGITLIGMISMWTGLMRIAEKAGIINGLTRKLSPLLSFLFPRIPKKHIARKYLATNIIANVIGLGWGATPPGLKAMKELQELNKDKSKASIEMATFLIINISSVQIISVTMLGYRAQYGSANPAEIVGPSLIATVISTTIGIIFCKIMMKVNKS